MEKTLFEMLQEKYPGREIRLILDEYVQTYLLLGFTIIHTDTQKSEVSPAYDIKYCFMLAP